MPSVYEYATEWSVEKLKKEYTKTRDIFMKQIKRLAKAKPEESKLKEYLEGGYKFPKKIRDIESLPGRKGYSERAVKEEWAFRLAELKQMQSARSLSLSGRKQIRQSIIKSLQEGGFTSINNKNADKFFAFMNWAKSQGITEEYGSDVVKDAYQEWVEGGVIEDARLAAYLQEFENLYNNSESIDLFD